MENDSEYRDLPWVGYLFETRGEASAFQEAILDIPGPVSRFGPAVICQVQHEIAYILWEAIRRVNTGFDRFTSYRREEPIQEQQRVKEDHRTSLMEREIMDHRMARAEQQAPPSTPFQRVLQGGMDKAKRAHPGLFEGEER